jgi:hypothetical protein
MGERDRVSPSPLSLSLHDTGQVEANSSTNEDIARRKDDILFFFFFFFYYIIYYTSRRPLDFRPVLWYTSGSEGEGTERVCKKYRPFQRTLLLFSMRCIM